MTRDEQVAKAKELALRNYEAATAVYHQLIQRGTVPYDMLLVCKESCDELYALCFAARDAERRAPSGPQINVTSG